MKKGIFCFILGLLFIASTAGAATLNLKATWTANTEPDMKEYRLYRSDGTRSLIGTIPHPTTFYLFTVTVPDGSSGILSFVLTAVDTNNNESLDSDPANYAYNLDATPPIGPKNLGVQNQ
ncbi:hypothetical protein A2Z67_04855 [Candidatus Woesebacteria bacterium RBG_13_36_22]|uniref:Fibronectin type-III domain-containing protein n=1 Tax=Candidatus Woesebacteria bacterium RBG_13_36_22 TaxID=1802478 RepID=A0A1F7X2B8_9BACT|nr:MAG: hypothetical protein A2Z67_04855 [Candidatus Woesebacteria bacterium RBG_13_36_22]